MTNATKNAPTICVWKLLSGIKIGLGPVWWWSEKLQMRNGLITSALYLKMLRFALRKLY